MNAQNLVTKANALVVAHYNTSLEELRIVRTLISMVQPQDEDFKQYVFKIAEFMDLLGVNTKTKYTEIPKITESLMKKVVKIKDNKRLLQISWLSSADYKYGEGVVELCFDPKLKPYLLDLKEKFITYKLENILSLTSKYSFRLYEILKCNEFKKFFELKLSEISEILVLGKSYKYFDIKRQILEPAKKELAEKTDISFNYETIKTGKKVTAIKFTIQPNKKNMQVLALEESSKPQTQTNIRNNGIPDDMRADIQTIQSVFYQRYKGELIDKFVEEMLIEKGYQYVRKCIAEYENYIQGRNIRNISGDFYHFVMTGYQKPTPYRGNKPQRDNFEQREYSREYLESFYVDLTKIEPLAQEEEPKDTHPSCVEVKAK